MMQSNEEFVKFLGHGTNGSVDLIKYTKSDGSSFHAAVKKCEDDKYEYLEEELQILLELRGCPGIVQCFGNDLEESFSEHGDRFYKLVLEYAPEGSLWDFMNSYTDRKLPCPMIRDFTHMILQGLVSIHHHGYVHCDLKPANILVFPCGEEEMSSYEVKICDFEGSVRVGDIPDWWQTDYPFVGTLRYMPPESFHDGVATKALDIWSLGCLVLEMYTGVYPWPGVETKDLGPLISDGNAPEIPESVPLDAREFIETCFTRNPEGRGSASELLLHHFFAWRREDGEDCSRRIF